jgi:hypothetical protein
MEIGRTSRSVVMATGIIREPDGSEHEVGFSSPNADLQVISVIGPGLLGLEVLRSSVSAAPGKVLEVPIKIARAKQLDGPVRIQLALTKTIRGISADSLVLSKGQDTGRLRIVCDATLALPPRASMVIHATALFAGDPVTAEATVIVVAESSKDI